MPRVLDNEKFSIYYSIIKNAYAFTHLQPYLKEFNQRKVENVFIIILLITGIISIFFVLFKFFIIFIYFFFIRLILNLKDFFISVSKNKGKYPYLTAFKNAMFYLAKNGKKIYTYNFYVYDKKTYGAIFFVSYFCFLISTFLFLYYINSELHIPEKSNLFYIIHIICFQFNLLIEILCSTFYCIRNLVKQLFLAFGFFLTLNLFIFLAYLCSYHYSNIYGSSKIYERVINIIICGVLFILHVYTLIVVITYDRKSNYSIFNYFYRKFDENSYGFEARLL